MTQEVLGAVIRHNVLCVLDAAKRPTRASSFRQGP
jgi:hypothetical protein